MDDSDKKFGDDDIRDADVAETHSADVVSPATAEDGLSGEDERPSIPSSMPMLPVRDTVIFPYMIIPLFVGRESSIQAVNEALSSDRHLFVASQKDPNQEEPSGEDVYPVGTAVMIMRMLKLPDGRLKILIQGLARSRISGTEQSLGGYRVNVETIEEPEEIEGSLEVEALMRSVRDSIEKAVNMGKTLSPDILAILENLEHPGRFSDLVASNMQLTVEQAQGLLETIDPVERLRRVNEMLSKEVEVLEMQMRIQDQAREEMTKTQREYYLREQLKAIKTELGDIDDSEAEIMEFKEKIERAKMPQEVKKEALDQVSKLERMHPDTAESSQLRGYLEWIVELPWGKTTKDSLDLKKAKQILDEDHFDLEKIKERILEHLGVCKLSKKIKGPILCFVGPPGVGKTSLGMSIARAMGRKFVRISLGGIKDEAEIRGHRRTYVGALPGKIIQGLKQAGSSNPVFMLDEIDKIGTDFRGDPSSALLEVLDPQQNNAFRDHYINLPYDLSGIMFITTANLIDPIPPALFDRMEVLHLAGYTLEEKLEIAKRYLVPRQLKENGITEKDLSLPVSTLTPMIVNYTREAGVRNLERTIGSVSRKIARKIAEGESGPGKVNTRALTQYLGAPQYIPESESAVDEVGCATGLAWTQFGGETLKVEVSMLNGKGTFLLTGQLGDVMKESAQAALSYSRSIAPLYGLPQDFFGEKEIHIHVPAGAIPKDGPSAGITIAIAIISAATGIPICNDVAMTGEITLRGKVLQIGGLKQKTLAAMRAGMKTVIAPHANKKDIEDIPPKVRKKIKLIFVKDMKEVIEHALRKKGVLKPAGKPKGASRQKTAMI